MKCRLSTSDVPGTMLAVHQPQFFKEPKQEGISGWRQNRRTAAAGKQLVGSVSRKEMSRELLWSWVVALGICLISPSGTAMTQVPRMPLSWTMELSWQAWSGWGLCSQCLVDHGKVGMLGPLLEPRSPCVGCFIFPRQTWSWSITSLIQRQYEVLPEVSYYWCENTEFQIITLQTL